MLQSIDSDVYIKVYLTGNELPGGFKRLESAIKQTLDDFQSFSNQKINYRFIDIYKEFKDDKERGKVIAELAGKGIIPTNIIEKKGGKNTQLLILPGAVLSYKSKELPVFLLKGNKLISPQEELNQATEEVEFELASAIKELTQTERKKIGFFLDYSSLPAIRQIDLIDLLKRKYDLFPVDLSASPTLEGLDAIFVLKPDKAFTEEDKFKIDQFIVKGGKALFFLDPVKIDSIGLEGNFATPFSVNLDDMFFKYGIRLNTNLLKDMQRNAAIPMNVGNFGENANLSLVQWPYYPIINSVSSFPIVRNLDAIYLKYVSTIDTVMAPNIVKIPLLQSSNKTQILNTPATISFNSAAKNFDPNTPNGGIKTIAYLLEGSFDSFFSNSILPTDPRYSAFKAKDKPSKIVICADADLPLNDVNSQSKQPLPLGFDRYSKYTFANKDFVKNAVDYLLDADGIIGSRNKIVKLRPLDKTEINKNSTYWQAINLIIPMVLLAGLAFIFTIFMKKKYR
jgi:gliding-associated putative ABC transporter substrate-binding component GldG